MEAAVPVGGEEGLLDAGADGRLLRADPVLVALRSGIDHLARHGSPTQVQRACYATFAMFVSWSAYAAFHSVAKDAADERPVCELRLFLRGVQAWMGGGFEWHATNPRYRSQRRDPATQDRETPVPGTWDDP